jgi:hypothetical protein
MRLSALLLALALLAPFAARAQTTGEVSVDVDLRADERYAICVRMLKERRSLEGRACLEQVIEETPKSAAAVRARAVLSALPPEPPEPSEVLARRPIPFKPGHLELIVAAGAFGIWNGAAAAIVLGASPIAVPAYVSAAGGAVAVALGGAYSIGTYFIADRLDVSAGDARFISSGVAWGTGLGLSLAPWAFALAGSPWPAGALPPLDEDFERALPFALIPTVAGGYGGVLVAVLVSRFVEMEPSQVGTLNTGGWIGFALGLTSTPLIAATGLGDPVWLGLWYLTTTSTGLAAGFGLSQLVRMDAWEVWLTDAGALAGLVVVGGGALLLRSGAPPGGTGDILVGAAATGGTLFGYAGALAAVAWFRVQRGEEFSRVGWLPVDTLFAPPTE